MLYQAPPPPPPPSPAPAPGPATAPAGPLLRRSARIAAKEAAKKAARAEARAKAAAPNPPPPPPPHKSETELNIAEILRFRIDDVACEVCKEFGDQCEGDACYARYLRGPVRRFDRAVELREAGDMGLGLFLKDDLARPIRKQEMLGQYLGELVPASGRGSRIPNYTYAFDLGGVATVDAREFGNYTRFANHHCKPNVGVRMAMIGRRQTILLEANRDLYPGEQLFIHYGRSYFEGRRIFCLCDAISMPHMPK
ncbi:uncharacterized protein PG986_010232 [Apiospora aurea]|uniref:SET domain-containing protein n=1 Tax=Apiospora aurea TaxID=335848 RepID=A0ABR1QB78_9PEZI